MAINQINVNGTVYTLDALPSVTASDAGKVLQVNASGEWVAATVSVAPSVESVSDSFRFYDFTNGLSGLGNNGYDDDGNALTPLTALPYLEKYTISPTNTAYSASLLSRFNPVVSGHSGAAGRSILAEIEMPDCTALPDENEVYGSPNVVFRDCGNLISASFPSCASIGSQAFHSCVNLVSVNFPACTTIGHAAFTWDERLSFANFPVCASISNFAFESCESLVSVSFPACVSVGTGAFEACAALESLTLNAACAISKWAFANVLVPDSKTFRLYLRGNSMGTCEDTAFDIWEDTDSNAESPQDLYSGTIPGLEIYVPASLLNNFKTTWAGGAFANNIYALTD